MKLSEVFRNEKYHEEKPKIFFLVKTLNNNFPVHWFTNCSAIYGIRESKVNKKENLFRKYILFFKTKLHRKYELRLTFSGSWSFGTTLSIWLNLVMGREFICEDWIFYCRDCHFLWPKLVISCFVHIYHFFSLSDIF